VIREIPGSGNWLPGQVQSLPPNLVVDIEFDASLAYGSTTGTGYNAIAAAIKASVIEAGASAEGSLTISAAVAAVVGTGGVASCGSVVFNGDPSIESVNAPIVIEAQYVRLTCRTIR
jgi:hypothetical protein